MDHIVNKLGGTYAGDIAAAGGRASAHAQEDLEVGVPGELHEYYGLTVSGVVAKAPELVKG